MVSTCSGNPVCVPPVSEFSPVSPWNSCVGLVDDCSFSSPQGRLLSSFIFCACPPRSWCIVLGFARAGSLKLLNTLRIRVTSDCCFACQSVFSSFPLTPAYSVQDIDRSPWRWMLYTITGWSGLPIPLFMFCSNLLNLWIWWHACSDVTASIFIVKWLRPFKSLLMHTLHDNEAPPWLVVGNWANGVHYEILWFAVFFSEKFDLRIRFTWVTSSFFSVASAGHSQTMTLIQTDAQRDTLLYYQIDF